MSDPIFCPAWEPSTDLRDLFARAKAEGLWFYNPYQGMWFAPSELADNQAQGRFRWGHVNWELRRPQELIAQLETTIEKAEGEIEKVKARMENSK